MNIQPTRRTFLRAAAAASALARVPLRALGNENSTPKKRFRKAVKFGMIGQGKTIKDKFELIKSLGFEGVEVDAPGGVDKQEAVDACKDTGIVIHGVLDATHWQVRMSDPDPVIREKALQTLLAAWETPSSSARRPAYSSPARSPIRKTRTSTRCGTVPASRCEKRSPCAKELGVHIAIEVVWNDFITTPQMMVKYVDQFGDPIVGAYLDMSNVLKYGKDTNMRGADWVRALGRVCSSLTSKATAMPKAGCPSAKATSTGPTSSRRSTRSATKTPPPAAWAGRQAR